MRRHSADTRNAALTQLSRVNRWLLAGSVLLTGVFAEIAANAFPGKTRSSGAHSARGGTGHTTSTSTGALKPPAKAPQPAPEHESGAAGEAGASSPSPEGNAPSGESAAPQSQAAPEAPAPAESQPPQESTPSPEPAPEASGPVVSGGS